MLPGVPTFFAKADRIASDFALWFASTPPSRADLEGLTHGAWYFSFDFVGRAMGSGNSAVRVASIQLTALNADGERLVLFSGAFRAAPSTAETKACALACIDEWCVRACREIASGSVIAGASLALAVGSAPSFGGQLAAWCRELFEKMFFLDIWRIGVVAQPVDEFLQSPEAVHWIPSFTSTRIMADPFAMWHEGALHILFEDLDYRDGKGKLCTFAVRPHPTRGIAEADVESTAVESLKAVPHLSYPYLFLDEDKIYCLPESWESGQTTLMRAVDFPLIWESVGQLLSDFPAVDPTVFRHGGRLWLFATKGGPGSSTLLYAWHAESLAGAWKPHLLNPIKCDVRSSRPAGVPFEINGVLYRPAQDCSQSYGGAIILNRVIELTPKTFCEMPAQRLVPDPAGPFPDGIHTICPAGTLTVVDGKRIQFHPLAALLRARCSRRRKARRAIAVGWKPTLGGRLCECRAGMINESE